MRREKREARMALIQKRRRMSTWLVGSAAVLSFVAAMLTVHFTGVLEPEQAPPATDLAAVRPEPVIPALLEADAERPNFRYSIVPGGVSTAQEVMDAMRDPVVAAHYVSVKTAELRSEELTEPMKAHVSYRVGDKVYWTKKKLTLNTGEKVLTDGTTTMRERCGNLISMQPLAPQLHGAEPAEREFELHVAPMVPTASVAQADAPGPGGFSLASAPPVISASALKGLLGAGDPPAPGGFVGPHLPPVGSGLPPSSSPPSVRSPTTFSDPPVLPPTPTPLPPGYPKDPPDPPLGDPPLGDPPTGTPTQFSEPPQVVPEPSTWLLIATGLGMGLRQILKKKRGQ